jgi:hypothetical protein
MAMGGQCKEQDRNRFSYFFCKILYLHSHTRLNAIFCISPRKKALDYKLHFFLKLPAKLKKFPLQDFVTRLLFLSSLLRRLDNKSQLLITSYLVAKKHTRNAFMFTWCTLSFVQTDLGVCTVLKGNCMLWIYAGDQTNEFTLFSFSCIFWIRSFRAQMLKALNIQLGWNHESDYGIRAWRVKAKVVLWIHKDVFWIHGSVVLNYGSGYDSRRPINYGSGSGSGSYPTFLRSIKKYVVK